MPSLSERLKATDKLTIHTVEEDGGTFTARHIPEPLYERLLALSLLVEAFQAAEQARKQAEADYRESGTRAALDYLTEMYMAVAAAKARLLEVNLG